MALPQSRQARHPISVDEYEQMIHDGTLTEDDRVELIAGEIVAMAAMGAHHADTIYTLTELLAAVERRDVIVSVQCPIRLADSEPEPDLALLRRKRYRDALPTPEDVFLVIEVADSTIESDRRRKFPRYAAAGIAEAWLVDVNGETVERHTEPQAGGYNVVAVARRGESLTSTLFPMLTLVVDDVLGTDDE